jgi:hypothetical protein
MSKKNLLGAESLAEKMQKIKNEMEGSKKQPDNRESFKSIPLKKTVSRKETKTNPKLFISGRLDRKKHPYTPKSLMLLTQIENEIKIYCRGGDLAILNYLIKEGLEKVKSSNETINVDMDEITSDII